MSQSNHLEVRDAYVSERERIQEVTHAAYEEYAMVMPTPFWEIYVQRLQATLQEEGPIQRIVAVNAGDIVGSVLLYPPRANVYGDLVVTAPAPEVRLLAVLPSARGGGVGHALMHACIQRARLMGATQLGLHTMDLMAAAVHMYEQMGFVHVPALDFHPTQEIVVKGFLRHLDD